MGNPRPPRTAPRNAGEHTATGQMRLRPVQLARTNTTPIRQGKGGRVGNTAPHRGAWVGVGPQGEGDLRPHAAGRTDTASRPRQGRGGWVGESPRDTNPRPAAGRR
ncbi:hypothetical protein GCM10022245_31500 [Streptomyces mayteni]